jgi:hypothetical protein
MQPPTWNDSMGARPPTTTGASTTAGSSTSWPHAETGQVLPPTVSQQDRVSVFSALQLREVKELIPGHTTEP